MTVYGVIMFFLFGSSDLQSWAGIEKRVTIVEKKEKNSEEIVRMLWTRYPAMRVWVDKDARIRNILLVPITRPQL